MVLHIYFHSGCKPVPMYGSADDNMRLFAVLAGPELVCPCKKITHDRQIDLGITL
jgi:hypothetical protein